MKIYHGSPNQNIDKFSLDNEPRYNSVEGRGVYMTVDYKIARGYAGSEGSIYVCELKTSAIFDATDDEEFNYLIELISKKINFSIKDVDYLKETISGLVSGEYRISDDDGGEGLFWQIKNLLLNTEKFCSLTNSDSLLEEIREFLREYMTQHPIIKYNDKNLGLIYLGKNSDYIKIINEIKVGSQEDEDLL